VLKQDYVGFFLPRRRAISCDTVRVKDTLTMPAAPVLQKGQRWNTTDHQMRIYRVGVHLVEFRLFKLADGTPQHKLVRSSLETVASVQGYLREHQAVLGEE
jgi:hypothetical protein